MAGRGRASSKKRQKEMARLEKRQLKAQRKQERKTAKQDEPQESDQSLIAADEAEDSSGTPGIE